MDEYYRAIQSLPSWLSRPLAELPVELAEQVHEIRLRVGLSGADDYFRRSLHVGLRPGAPANRVDPAADG